jgi:two-component system nitrogen regulation sensor histidine kinase GlnL
MASVNDLIVNALPLPVLTIGPEDKVVHANAAA